LDEKPHQNISGQQYGNRVPITPMFGGVSDSTCVYVGNLPFATKWHQLKDMCRPFGDIVRADIEENEDGRSKGYGLVRFANSSSALLCVANLHGMLYEGRDLNVHIDKFDGVPNSKGPVRVFVGNLPWSFNKWQDLKDLCRNFGDVIRAEIEEEEGGRSKGYGIVTFSSSVGAQNCIANLNGQVLNGRELNVRLDRFKK